MKKLWWLCCLVFLTVFAVQPAFKMSATPGSIRRRAPRLGEHNAEILQALGYDTAAREQLKKDGAI